MTRILYVGDVHPVPDELDDCRSLIHYVHEVAEREKVDAICFLGDNHHTHGILRLEVVFFWKWAFDTLAAFECIVLVGNHDQLAGGSGPMHALICYGGTGITVADAPIVRHGVLFMPYYPDRDAFVLQATRFPECPTLVCHQTFDGAEYENGFPAHDGVDPALVPQADTIVGHIHTAQRFGKVWYVGAPRWRTASDANVQRAIHVVEHDAGGRIVAARSFSTDRCCRPIYAVVDTPEAPFGGSVDERCDWRVTIEGPDEWIRDRLLAYPAYVKVRTVRRQREAPKVRESEGIAASFHRFVGAYEPEHGTPTEILARIAKERIAHA